MDGCAPCEPSQPHPPAVQVVGPPRRGPPLLLVAQLLLLAPQLLALAVDALLLAPALLLHVHALALQPLPLHALALQPMPVEGQALPGELQPLALLALPLSLQALLSLTALPLPAGTAAMRAGARSRYRSGTLHTPAGPKDTAGQDREQASAPPGTSAGR